jgi:D-alanine transaminase
MPDIAYLNGKWLPISQAKVSVEDRGFQFADGVYELIRVYGGQPFHLREHLERLLESARQIEIASSLSIPQLERIARLGCRNCGYPSAKIYIQLTRGTAPRLHHFPEKIKPTWVMTFRKLVPIEEATRKRGVSVLTIADVRWGRCNIKSLNLLPNVMAREQAARAGCFETLFIRDGIVTEGAGSNVFAVIGDRGDRVVTPPEGPAVLSGITREVILDLGKKAGLLMVEAALSVEQLRAAHEVFLTGTTIEILPVVRLDGKKIASGRPGPVSRALHQAFLSHLTRSQETR